MSPTALIVLLAVVGAVVGGLDGSPALGAGVGALLGLWLRDARRLREAEGRLRQVEETVRFLGVRQSVGDGAAEPLAPDAGEGVPEPPSLEAPPVEAIEVGPAPRREPGRPLRPAPPRAAPDRPARAEAPEWAQRAWAFATGGNPLARVGLVVLFVGVGLLLRYAAEQGFFPIEVRLAFAAGVGAVLLGLGWRLRERSAALALTLQGGGVAVLYLTVYAAYALYALVPSLVAIALMALVAAGCAALALAQDAPALAVVGVAGGFAAPVLAGTEAGNHVLLLGYYALLNLGVLGIAWRRGWRSVAVVGFVSTFVTGGLWGGLAYRPDLYASVQPFVALSFSIYLALAVRFAVRSVRAGAAPERALVVDGALVFGLPAATFVLQAGLVEGVVPYGRAWSAVVLAAVYLVGAALVRRQRDLGLLGDAFLAVGLAFATLAAPLAFGRVVFGAVWVLEGAGLVWVGARQRKAWMRWAGLALQAAAALVLFVEGVLAPDRAFSAETLTGWIVAVALGLSAYVLRGAAGRAEAVAGRLSLAFALFWWTTTAFVHVLDLIPGPYRVAGLLGAAAASAAVFLGVGRALGWRGLAAAALGLVPVAWALWVFGLFGDASPAEDARGLAWTAVFAVGALALWMRRGDAVRRLTFAPAVWLLVAVVADAAARAAGGLEGAAWPLAVVGAALAVGLALSLRLPEAGASADERRWTASGLTLAGAAWLAFAAVSAGGSAPLPYVPVLNPVDGVSVALLVALAAAARALPPGSEPRRTLWSFVAGLGFVALTAAVLRTVHQWGGTAWTAGALLASSTAQAALAVVWTLFALGLAVAAVREQSRAVWFFGAGVLGLVVAKLFVVDLAQAQALVLIGAFIAVGALVILIAYLAPLPPRRDEVEA